MSRWKVIKKCWNQDDHKILHPGDIVDTLSAFEIGRHLAEKNIVPVIAKKIETTLQPSAQEERTQSGLFQKRGRSRNV